MSTLTKILIVVLTVLVLAAAVLFIQQGSQHVNWRAAYQAQKLRADQAEAQTGNQQLAANVWKQYYETARAQLDKQVGDAQNALAGKDVRINELSALAATNAGRLTDLNASLDALEKDQKGMIALNQTLTTQADVLRKQNSELTDQVHRAQDTIREFQAGNEILTKSQRALQEEVAQLKRENTDLRDKLESAGVKTPGAAPTVRPPKIEATVTAVDKDLASVNVGSADGVQKDMEFVIYRDSTFVGHLRIAEVYASSAAGVIIDSQRDVRRGDKATTRLE